jgi:hypothetical protein
MRAKLSLVERFFHVLVEEIRDSRPEYLEASFTVAEIYQSLVPYRTHRDRIGAEINGDYEDALLRLLGGEGEFLELDSETARERIRLELRSSNPNTGLYREYAAVRVRLNPEMVPDEAERRTAAASDEASGQTELAVDEAQEPEGEPEVERTEPVRDFDRLLARREEPGDPPSVDADSTSELPQPDPVPQQVDTDTNVEREMSADAPASCPDCGEGLPQRESLRFCPFCGVDVFEVPCDACGEVLERDWSFCLACGTARG